MRQVNEDEVIHVISFALQQLPASLRAQMLDRRPDQQGKGNFFAAQRIAKMMRRWEILSSHPAPPPFRFADIEGGSGVPAIED